MIAFTSRFKSTRAALQELWWEQIRWLIPTDPRAIVLCCFFSVAAGIGGVALINGDPIGWGYLAIGIGGCVFAQTRLMPTLLWLLVAAVGFWAVSAGSTAAWIEVYFAVVLTRVALVQVANPDVYPPFGSPAGIPQPNLNRTSATAEVSLRGPLDIRTLGRLQILDGDTDLAASILDKRVLGYLWCWLLAVAIRTRDGAVGRAEVAAELSAGPNRRAQLEHLRRTLWDLQHNLPRPLAALVCVDRNFIRLDIASASCDLVQLRDLLAALSDPTANTDLSEADLRARLESISSDRFLPEFDDLARSANRSRGAGIQAVNDLRTWALRSRVDAARLIARRTPQLASSEE